MEAQFASKNLTAEETKFNHAVQELDKSTAEEISAFLTSPPAQGRYMALKDLLLDTFGLTQDEKDSRLFAQHGYHRRPLPDPSHR